MTIPRFAAFCAAAATILIFVGVWTIEQAYGALIEGKAWTDMSLPLWAIAVLLLSSAAAPRGCRTRAAGTAAACAAAATRESTLSLTRR